MEEIREIRISAKTLGEAITDASVALGVPSDGMEYSILQHGSNGFLGIGAKPFIISARVKAPEEPASALVKEAAEEFVKAVDRENRPDAKKAAAAERPEKAEKFEKKEKSAEKPAEKSAYKPAEEAKDKASEKKENRRDRKRSDREKNADRQDRADRRQEKSGERKNDRQRGQRRDAKPAAEKPAAPEKPRERKFEKVNGDPKGRAEEFLTSLFASMEMKIDCSAKFDDTCNELYIDLSGEDMGVLIGKRGQTLDALQYLTSQVVNKHLNTYVRVKMDTENYRERRKETLETLAVNIAQKVKRTHRPVALEPMNPYERRIIHSILQGEKEVMTRSEGEEPYRHVVVCPVKKKRYGATNNFTSKAKAEAVPAAEETAETFEAAAENAEAAAENLQEMPAEAVMNEAEAAMNVDNFAESAAESAQIEFTESAEITETIVTEETVTAEEISE